MDGKAGRELAVGNGCGFATWSRLLALALLAVVGCQRAARYPAAKSAPAAEKITPAAQPIWTWYLPEGWVARDDVPITFIAPGNPGWGRLSAFWNNFPPPAGGIRTIHLGQSPLAAAAGAVMTHHAEVVRLKVPLGLPDPASHIPTANPPTMGKWKLGRRIFYDSHLHGGGDTFSCASCHEPAHGFAQDRGAALGGTRNTLSLLNVVYNRRQFWDGRAESLEEVVVRALEDELPEAERPTKGRPQETHRWGGLVNSLSTDPDYRDHFQLVFGTQPTQDAIAKALATYLRTILSGNSLYDRADADRRTAKKDALLAAHFEPHLDAATLKALGAPPDTKAATAQRLEAGARLFQSKNCAACHSGSLFTDEDYHNIGIADSDHPALPGQETGRFPHAPIGLKEARLVGAYRTPTLRNLPRTAPYFHDGSARSLALAVKYFNLGPSSYHHYLAQQLHGNAEGHSQPLGMSDEDQENLVLFLRSLDGEPVDRVLLPMR